MSILPDSVAHVRGVTDAHAAHASAACESSADHASSSSAIAAMVDPPVYCPGCLAEAGLPFPARATTRHCRACLDRIRRVYQCARWNQNHAHQVAAGHASWDAFSARWRASGGLAPLSTEAARRYVTPEMIRGPMGVLLPAALREAIHRAWLAGQLVGVAAWLSDDPPPESHGLWATAASAAWDACNTPGTAAEEGHEEDHHA